MNGYCRLAYCKADLAGVTGSDMDATLLRAIEEASRQFDRDTHRIFYSETGTFYYDGTDGDLWMPDDFVAITSLNVDSNLDNTYATSLVADADYFLWPYNGTPKRRIDLNFTGGQLQSWGGYYPGRRVKIVGQRGYSNETEATGQTIGNLISIGAGDTSITVADSDCIDLGETLVIESEQMYVTGVPDSVTLAVTRGINGTTAAAHMNGVGILRRRYPRDVEAAVASRAVGARWDSQSGQSGMDGGSGGSSSSRVSFAKYMTTVNAYRQPVFA